MNDQVTDRVNWGVGLDKHTRVTHAVDEQECLCVILLTTVEQTIELEPSSNDVVSSASKPSCNFHTN